MSSKGQGVRADVLSRAAWQIEQGGGGTASAKQGSETKSRGRETTSTPKSGVRAIISLPMPRVRMTVTYKIRR